MSNARISTTISARHIDILKKHAKVHGTQQKVLELALETFDKKTLEDHILTTEELFVLNTWRDRVSCIVYKELFTNLISNANLEAAEEWYNANKMCMAFAVEFYYQRPFHELNIQEILDALVSLAKISNMFERYAYSDDGDHYTLKIHHNYGLNGSRYVSLMVKNILDFCGVKYTTSVTERSIFTKIYKNGSARNGVSSVPRPH